MRGASTHGCNAYVVVIAHGQRTVKPTEMDQHANAVKNIVVFLGPLPHSPDGLMPDQACAQQCYQELLRDLPCHQLQCKAQAMPIKRSARQNHTPRATHTSQKSRTTWASLGTLSQITLKLSHNRGKTRRTHKIRLKTGDFPTKARETTRKKPRIQTRTGEFPTQSRKNTNKTQHQHTNWRTQRKISEIGGNKAHRPKLIKAHHKTHHAFEGINTKTHHRFCGCIRVFGHF